MYHSGSWGVLVIFLGPLSRPTGEKGYVSFRELGSTGNLSWATTRPTGEKGYVPFRELGSTGNLSWATIETHWGEGVCIIQGAGEYW